MVYLDELVKEAVKRFDDLEFTEEPDERFKDTDLIKRKVHIMQVIGAVGLNQSVKLMAQYLDKAGRSPLSFPLRTLYLWVAGGVKAKEVYKMIMPDMQQAQAQETPLDVGYNFSPDNGNKKLRFVRGVISNGDILYITLPGQGMPGMTVVKSPPKKDYSPAGTAQLL